MNIVNNFKKSLENILYTVFLAILIPTSAFSEVRIKDIVHFEGVRINQLIGYGLVVGLNGTGDNARNSPFTQQSIEGMLQRLGVGSLPGDSISTKNTAAVMVTANLPAFARIGSSLDVTISSLGDSSSLQGGTLLVTPLMAADGQVYAVGQGAISVAGFAAQGNNATVVEGVPTVARVENGAIVEREIPFELNSLENFRVSLRNPDFTTAKRVTDSINDFYGKKMAIMLDSGTIEVNKDNKSSIPMQIAEIENLTVTPDNIAKVVVDAKSGTIVIGADVKIDKVAISQGGLTVKIEEQIIVNQPESFSIGDTTITPATEIEINEKDTQFVILEGDVSLKDLVEGLNKIGVGAQETISILQAIKASGALHADLEII